MTTTRLTDSEIVELPAARGMIDRLLSILDDSYLIDLAEEVCEREGIDFPTGDDDTPTAAILHAAYDKTEERIKRIIAFEVYTQLVKRGTE